MDFLKGNKTETAQPQQQQGEGQGASQGGGGFMDKINSSMGGGQAGERNEDALDKGVDFVQERFMGAGDQSNESAIEQAKDEQISDAVRRGLKSTTGRDFPVADK